MSNTTCNAGSVYPVRASKNTPLFSNFDWVLVAQCTVLSCLKCAIYTAVCFLSFCLLFVCAKTLSVCFRPISLINSLVYSSSF